MAKKGSFSKVYDKNGDYADVEAVRFDGTRTFQMQGDVTASQTWNGDSNTALTLNASIGAKKVTQDKIGDKAVGSGQMGDGSVGLTQMDPNAMTSSAIDGDDRLITSGGVRTEIDNAILNRGKDYGPMTPTQINAITGTIPTGSTVHVTEAGTITDGDIVVRAGEDLRYYSGNGEHYWYSLDGDFKLKQNAKSSPTASGNTLEFIDSITQDENGEITATKKAVQDGTTSQKGVVQLEDSHSSTSTSKAATPNSVKEAYDLANTANTGAVKSVAYDSTNKKITKTINGQTTDVVSAATLKTDMALNNVDNTSDVNKPVSTAQQAALDLKLDKTGDGKDVTATFTEASTREENIGTGEKLSVMFGKIKKWFSDLGTAAFKNVPASGDASSTEVVLGSDTRLSAGASAIQGVKVNNTTLTPDANKVVTVPLATTSADGAMSAGDKVKLTNITEHTYSSGSNTINVKICRVKFNGPTFAAGGACFSIVQRDWLETNIISLLSLKGDSDGETRSSIFITSVGKYNENFNYTEFYVTPLDTTTYEYDVYVRIPAYSIISFALLNGLSASITWETPSQTSVTIPSGAYIIPQYEGVKKLARINGTSSLGAAVGSASVPTYVDASGVVIPCTDDFVHDGDVTSTYSATGTDPVNGAAVAQAVAKSYIATAFDGTPNSITFKIIEFPLNQGSNSLNGIYFANSGASSGKAFFNISVTYSKSTHTVGSLDAVLWWMEREMTQAKLAYSVDTSTDILTIFIKELGSYRIGQARVLYANCEGSPKLDELKMHNNTPATLPSSAAEFSVIKSRDASWINSGVFDADRIPVSLPNVTAGSATTATNYASGGGIANALAGKQNSLSWFNDSEAVSIWADAKTAAANAS